MIAFADMPANTEYIAICNPAAVLALISEVERLERENADLDEHIKDRDSLLSCGLVDCPVRRD